MSNKLKKFLVDATKTHLENIYEEKQMNDNGVYSPIEFTLSEKEQKKVNEKIREINSLFNSSDKAKDYHDAREKIYSEINYVIKNVPTAERNPGYADGLYRALDIITEEMR